MTCLPKFREVYLYYFTLFVKGYESGSVKSRFMRFWQSCRIIPRRLLLVEMGSSSSFAIDRPGLSVAERFVAGKTFFSTFFDATTRADSE